MSAADDNENQKVFYRTLATPELLRYRAALTEDLALARRAGGRMSKGTITFCDGRRQLIAEVLAERGIEALN
jgi:hypothetical protein